MKFVSIFFIFLLSVNVQAELRGFHKLNTLSFRNTATDEETNYIFQNNRLTYLDTVSSWQFELSYELSMAYLDSKSLSKESFQSQLSRKYRLDDVNSILWYEGKGFLVQNLDRFILSNELLGGRITFGRQQISFGSATFVNPTDVFTPFSLLEIDTEERPGVDAIRLRKPIGEMGELDVGVLIGPDDKKSALYLAVKLPTEKYELQPLIAYYQQATLLGFDYLNSIEGSNIWLEIAHTITDDGNEYARASLGVNRIFTAEFTGVLEYHYNGSGSNDVDEYVNLLTGFAIMKGGSHLLSTNYLSASGVWQYSPLTTLAFSIQSNLMDSSSLLNLSAERSITNEFVFNIGVYSGVGKSSEVLTSYKSEFGQIPATLFTRLRYYF